MPPFDVAAASETLEGRSPADILRWATHHAGPRIAFATGLGVEGCVLIDVISRAHLPIDLFTIDTGVMFEETYELWRRLETIYNVSIRGVRPAQTLDEQAAQFGPALWERDPDRCCELRKVIPLRRVLARFDSWVTPIRRDQTPERGSAQIVEIDPTFHLVKVNPLVAWSHDDVWAYVYANDVPINPLHHQGYPSIGCKPCTSAIVRGEDLRAGRWRNWDKRECGLHLAPAKQRKGDNA